MEKELLLMALFYVAAITNVLAIPTIGIDTEKDNSISRELQWCCAPNEDEDEDDYSRD